MNHAGQRLERNGGATLEVTSEPRKAPRAVAAHFRFAAILLKNPTQIGVALGFPQQQDSSAQPHVGGGRGFESFGGQLEPEFAIVDHHEIVFGPVHLGEINQHERNLTDWGVEANP